MQTFSPSPAARTGLPAGRQGLIRRRKGNAAKAPPQRDSAQAGTTALPQHQSEPQQENGPKPQGKRQGQEQQEKGALGMEQVERLPGRDAHLQQAAVERSQEQHRSTTQHEGLESREQGGTGGGNATAVQNRNRKTHFFFHRRKTLKVELHDAKKQPRRVNLRHDGGFFC